MKIYVADLACYVAGNLHGVWIDLENMDLDSVQEEIEEMLKEGHAKYSSETLLEKHEEYAFHDYEDTPTKFEEYEKLEYLIDVQETIDRFDVESVEASFDLGLYDELRSNSGSFGVYESEIEFAENWIDGSGDLPKSYERYFDFEQFGTDLLQDYSHTYVNDSLLVWYG